MNASVQNLEEATNLASEFIYSVENLPNEITHLLQEIRHKEHRAQELQHEIDKDSARYIRHSLRASNAANASPPPSRAPSPKSSLLPAKIAASYAEIDELSSEKCLLSQQIIDLVTRTRARLDSDLTKVRILQGEAVDYPALVGDGFVMTGRNAALQIGESLRSALATPAVAAEVRSAPLTPAGSVGSSGVGSGPSANKRRRVTGAAAVKITAAAAATPPKVRAASPSVTASVATAQTHPRSRLSRQVHPPKHDSDMDAEGDDDADAEDADGDDERLYCFCQKQSYGDMIACDNEGGCPYEWFHLTCVGMKQPTPEKWYCSVCKAKGAGSTTGRKSRKK